MSGLNLLGPAAVWGVEGTTVVVDSEWLRSYLSLGAPERVVGQFLLTVVIAAVVIGMIHRYGTNAVAKARRSPVISICIGAPTLLVVVGLAGTGYYMLGSSLGTFFGIVFLALGFAAVPTTVALGFVAIGRSVASRLGRSKLWHGILTGGLLAGVVGLSLPATVVAGGLAGALGTGALVRILLGAGGTTSPDDRTVPPANNV